MRTKTLLIFLCIWAYSNAQTTENISDTTNSVIFSKIETSKPEEGTIRIIQNPLITELINRHAQNNLDAESRISGWRVQIYNSTGRETRADVTQIRNQFLSRHPELEAYIVYQPPIFRIRVGNFRTREDAYFYYKRLVRDYPSAYLVRDQINLPQLHQ